MITYADTLGVHKGMPVFLPGEGTFASMEGRVTGLDTQRDLISVKWDHPAMVGQSALKYDAARFQDTTDRDGIAWLVLDL